MIVSGLTCPSCNESDPQVRDWPGFGYWTATCCHCGASIDFTARREDVGFINLPDDVRPDQLFGEPA